MVAGVFFGGWYNMENCHPTHILPVLDGAGVLEGRRGWFCLSGDCPLARWVGGGFVLGRSGAVWGWRDHWPLSVWWGGFCPGQVWAIGGAGLGWVEVLTGPCEALGLWLF